MSYPFGPSARLLRLALFLSLAAAPHFIVADGVYHVLQRGETLYSVARSYGVQADALAQANSITDPSKLRVGKRLRIPGAAGSASDPAPDQQTPAQGQDEPTDAAAQRHKVLKGETLFSIAKSYGVGIGDLRTVNKLSPTSLLKAGEVLLIPAGSKSPASQNPPTARQQDQPSPPDTAAPSDPQARETSTATPSGAPVGAPAVPDALKTTVKAVSKDLSWPCPGEILYLEGKAYGILIRAKLGEAMKAVASGTVSSAGPYRGYGNVVFVLSKTGYIYVYGGNDNLSVRAGEQVKVGEELGRVGMDAKEGAPAAYFLVFKNGSAVDPATAPRE
jgi:murein DD-endopeptidase MepM/ murein hydrolase activator NlpD